MDEKQYYDNHYAEMLVQPIEVMQELLAPDQLYASLLFNINKYDCRAGHKAGEAISKDETKRDRYIAWAYIVKYTSGKIDPKCDYDCPAYFKKEVLNMLREKRAQIENERKQNGKKI